MVVPAQSRITCPTPRPSTFTRFLINPSVSFTCQLEVDFEVDKKSVTKEDEIELLLADEFGNKMVFDKTDI